MALLTPLPPAATLELWARLSRAAATKGCFLAARECADAALRSAQLPAGVLGAPYGPESASAAPGVTREAWFWLAVAEEQRGQVGIRGPGVGGTPAPRAAAGQAFGAGC